MTKTYETKNGDPWVTKNLPNPRRGTLVTIPRGDCWVTKQLPNPRRDPW